MRIEFDFKVIKEFIDDLEEDNIGRCGERYYTSYRLLEDGSIQYRHHSFGSGINTEWSSYHDIKGEVRE